ncbi:serine dehydratase-like isoform X1 [Apostichopus japonicus]|uniref:serine dehydratase-like isoform X1 n=1 Tax=Stichopus japonicus TaxID=307972 RepID=UPI003AB8328A
MAESVQLHIATPLLESIPLTKRAGFPVFVKCENAQPSGSFKIRGIGHRCRKAVLSGCKHIISSSGGNAGYAAAYAAKQLGVKATIVVPETTAQNVRNRMSDAGAQVIVHGKVWDEANDRAQDMIAKDKEAIGIHPFDHPDVWAGHATLVEELANELPQKPDLIITSVGGGGLLCGIAEGLDRVGWQDVPVLAMETVGADCFNKSVEAGKSVTLPAITSVAKCLGALTPAAKCMECIKDHKIYSEVIPDKEAIRACLMLLDDHCILVEPACGAALAGIYARVIHRLQEEKKLQSDLKCVVAIVCGGYSISLEELLKFKKDFNL